MTAAAPFVPAGFEPPTGLVHPDFHLVPLRPEHNEADFEAWSSSAEHIHRTPGFEGRDWPRPMTLEENLGDLIGHADDFASGQGFTYTVQDPAGRTVGCVYLYPSDDPDVDVDVRSWVRADRAELDVVLHDAVEAWIGSSWPFDAVRYAPRV